MRRKFDLSLYQNIVIKLKNKKTKPFEKRKKQMQEMRKSGKTYGEIGRTFGISRQRVYQILKGGK